MAEITNKKWSTTFFYGQDLRSLYFNGLLSSILRPGIQNGNICIYYNANNGSFDLYLKKGTTLLFSNKYSMDVAENAFTEDAGVSRASIVRDLSEPGSFLIKSTALQDMNITLLILDDTNNQGKLLKKFFEASEVYVYATMAFNGEGDLKDGNVPRFKWALRRAVANDEQEAASKQYEKGLFFRNSGVLSTSVEYKILDGEWWAGDRSYATVNYSELHYYERTMYTLLGRIIPCNTTYSYSAEEDYSVEQYKRAAVNWIQDHQFTSRGLPDYRTDFTYVSSGLAAGLIPRSSDRFNYQADLRSVLIKNKIRTLAETDWMKSLGITEEMRTPTAATFTAARILKDGNNIIAAPNTSSDYRDTVLHGDTNLEGQSAKIVFDFFYFLHRDEDDRQLPRDLDNLLEPNSLSANVNVRAKTFTWVANGILPSGEGINNKSVLLRNTESYRYSTNPYVYFGITDDISPVRPGVSTATSTNAFSSYNNNLDIGKVFWGVKPETSTKVIQPLDMSPLNLERFEYFLADTDFVPNLINLLRQEYPEYLCLSDDTSSIATTLIPVGLAIRPFIKFGNKWYLADSLVGIGEDNKNYLCDTTAQVVTPDTCPPNMLNVFSFFDLKSKGASIKEYNLESTDLYTLIPIIK